MWGGHTRRLLISPAGRGGEDADDGRCHPLYRITFQIVSVGGSLTRATATYRVTSYKWYDRPVPHLHRGQVGKLQIRNGIITNVLTHDYFCSNPAWGATAACGA